MDSKFSDRIGLTRPANRIQIKYINDALRNSMWNVIFQILEVDKLETYLKKAVRTIGMSFLKKPVDELPDYHTGRRQWLKEVYFKLEWHEAYNLIEFIVSRDRYITNLDLSDQWIERFNFVLKRELSGYRFVGGILSLISNEAEVASIEEALAEAERKGFAGAHTHLATALKSLGQKPEPDYRNSIKEAISAVESIRNSQSSATGICKVVWVQ